MTAPAVRAALKAGDAVSAHAQFISLPNVHVDFALLSETVLAEDYSVGWISLDVTLDFLAAFDDAQWTLAGCRVIHTIHTNQQARASFTNVPVFRFAAFVRETVERLQDPIAKARANAQWMQWFSATVRAVVERNPIRFQSALRYQIMYAPVDGYRHDESRRNIFTWQWAWEDDGNYSEHFVAEPVDSTWETFHLRSVPYDELVYAERVQDEEHPTLTDARLFSRCVASERREHQQDGNMSSRWKLLAQDGMAHRNVFVVVNTHTNEFMYSPDESYDGSR